MPLERLPRLLEAFLCWLRGSFLWRLFSKVVDLDPALVAHDLHKDQVLKLNERELAAYLKLCNFPTKVINELDKEGFTGKMLLEFEEKDYHSIFGTGKFTKAQLQELLNHKNKLGETKAGDPEPTTVKHLQSPKGKTANKTAYQVPRKFQASGKSTKYKQGHILPPESGPNFPEPSREYKEFTYFNLIEPVKRSYNELETAFVNKFSRFAFACLNARCRGTIYFGVGDSDNAKKSHKPGQVVGLPLGPDDKKMFLEIFDKNIRGFHPKLLHGGVPTMSREMKVAVQSCILQPQFVPVSGKEDGLYIIEIDIEPTSERCRDMLFFVPTRQVKNPKKNDLTSGDKNIYYLREGTSSIQCLTHDRERMQYLRDKKNEAVLTLKLEERRICLRNEHARKEEKIVFLLCRGLSSGLPNSDLLYVLILDHFNEDEITKKLQWLCHFKYLLVVDLGNQLMGANKPPFYKLLREESKTKGNYLEYVESSDMCQDLKCQEASDYLKKHKASRHTLYISARNKKSTLLQKICPVMANLIGTWFKPAPDTSLSRVVINVLISNGTRLTAIGELLRIFGNVIHDHTQYVIMHSQDVNLGSFNSYFLERFGHDQWKEQQVSLTSFEELNSYMLQKMTKSQDIKHEVPGSSLPCIIDKTNMNHFQENKLLVLTQNQNQIVKNYDESEKQVFFETCLHKMKDFLQGKVPEWHVFYSSEPTKHLGARTLQSGLVERDCLKNILKDLEELGNKEENLIVSKIVRHRPGAGATTIGRHILWKLRETKRCAMVDGNNFLTEHNKPHEKRLQELSRAILDLRALGELEIKQPGGHCPVLLILVDNATEKLVDTLQSHLIRGCKGRKIEQAPCIMLLSLVRSSGETDKGMLEQRLSSNEKELFKEVLETLVDDAHTNPEDILSFVIMAVNFDQDSEYVINVVRNTIHDMDIVYPLQEQLLMYLAVLKYYDDSGFPEPHCINLSESIMPFHQFCPQFLTFVHEVARPTSELNVDLEQHYNFFEITHGPVANQLVRQLRQKHHLKLSEVLEDILEKAVLPHLAMKDMIHTTVRKLLTRRRHNEHGEKDEFSKVILALREEESKEAVHRIFHLAYNKLEGHINKALIMQAQARFFLSYQNFKEALEVAKKAKELAPDNFAIIDTTGQVYRRWIEYLKPCLRKNYQLVDNECQRILTYGHLALDNFKDAESKFDPKHHEMATTNHGWLGLVECNLAVVQILLGCNEAKKLNKSLTKLLRGDVVEELSNLFPTIDWRSVSWANTSHYIHDIFHSTYEGITRVAEILHSSDEHTETRAKVSRNIANFYEVFGTDLEKVSEIAKSKDSPNNKLRKLRKILLLQFTKSLSCLIVPRNVKKDMVEAYSTVLKNIQLVCQEAVIQLKDEDKLSFLNVYFALIYYGENFSSKPFPLSWASMQGFSKDLFQDAACNSGEDKSFIPEKYLHYLMLNWPVRLKTVDSGQAEAIKLCVERLSSWQENGRLKGLGAIRPLFYLKKWQRDKIHFVSSKDLSAADRDNLLYEMRGESNPEDGKIKLKISKETSIFIASSHPKFIGRAPKRVTFRLGFGFAGPIACWVKQALDDC